MRKIFEPSGCLSLETLKRYKQEAMSREETHEVEKHLVDCELCSDVLEGISEEGLHEINKHVPGLNNRINNIIREKDEKGGIFYLKRFGPMAASVALLISLFWYVSNFNTEEEAIAENMEVMEEDGNLVDTIATDKELELTDSESIEQSDSNYLSEAEPSNAKSFTWSDETKENKPVAGNVGSYTIVVEDANTSVSDYNSTLQADEDESASEPEIEMPEEEYTQTMEDGLGFYENNIKRKSELAVEESISDKKIQKTIKQNNDRLADMDNMQADSIVLLSKTAEDLTADNVKIQPEEVKKQKSFDTEIEQVAPAKESVAEVAESFDGRSRTTDSKADKTQIESKKQVAAKVTKPESQHLTKSGATSAPAPADEISENRIYETVEKMPEFPGGQDSLNSYIERNLKNGVNEVKSASDRNEIVKLSMVVNENGRLSDIRITENLDAERDKLALDLVRNMPPWIPGEHHNQKVKVRVSLEIKF